jgi:glyoxylase-like metal-dependent hydrolase (beta-lactamase superfamily II)
MFFIQRVNNDASISYFFGCGGLGKAVAVDVVAGDEAWFLSEATRLNVQITMVFDTHIHADHLSGGRTLADLAGAEYLLHAKNQGKTGFTFAPVADGEVRMAGNTRVLVRHTPGHTEDSICLLVSDHRRSESPWFALTGDTLLVGAVGRPDLSGQVRAMAGQLWHSLHERLLDLPDDLEIFPGHTAGSPCGAGTSGKPSSTIGFERRCNPVLSLTKQQFIDTITSDIPARPANMEAYVAANLGQAVCTA